VTEPSRRADGWQLSSRRLYLCTPDRQDLARFLDACLGGGVDIVQLRDKNLPEARVAERAAVAQEVCAHHRVPFILNDRPDLAAAIGADGVHVGQDDLSPIETRAIVGDQAIVGLSTHASSELATTLGPVPAPVDYLSAGPVTPTPTKPGRPGTGLGYITEAAQRSPWPVWITGGVVPDAVAGLVAGGGRHFVVVRWLTEAEDPAANARLLRQAIDQAIDQAIERALDAAGDQGSGPLPA
jgi:thiamine-phosphate pyrophosphorylase